MNDGPVELRKLIEEAARETYSPRAKRCWVFHHWTMWQEMKHPTFPREYRMQFRRCVGCGKTKYKTNWIL
jgi:hypothetical protein